MCNIHQIYASSGIKLPAVTYEDCYEYFRNRELYSAANYNKELNEFKFEFTYNSNLISGIRVDYYVTKAVMCGDDIPGYIGKFENLVIVNNFGKLFDIIWSDLLKGRQIGLSMLTDYHRVLMNSTSCDDIGRYRKENYPCNHLSDIVEGQHVLRILQDVIDMSRRDVNDTIDDTIQKAIELGISVERIRPFTDGNGRIARVLLNYTLLAGGLPPVVIYNTEMERYFDLIKSYEKINKLSGIDFIKRSTILTWEKKIIGGN